MNLRPWTKSAFLEFWCMLQKYLGSRYAIPVPPITQTPDSADTTRKTLLNEFILLFGLSLVHESEQIQIFVANEVEPVAAICMMVYSATVRWENGARPQQKTPNFMLGAYCMDNGARQHNAEREYYTL